MKYTIYKDTEPVQTIKKIKNILDNLSIKVNEEYIKHSENNVTSVRITIDGSKDVGTNGKGTNELNALASGYAEFMERLQTNFLIRFRGKELDEEEIEWSLIPNYFQPVLPANLKSKFYNLIKIKKEINQLKFDKNNYKKVDNNSQTTTVVPFYELKSNQTELIPIDELKYLQTTTGISAGNTYEEAAVQAISEICERYSIKQILTKKINMPEIPLKYYKDVPTIKNLINFIENNGYKITIKDASLGCTKSNAALPVICTIFEQKGSNGENCQIRFGSHLSLYIAIERTLTEFMQGYQIEDQQAKDYVNMFRDLEETKIDDKLGDFYHSNVVFSKNNKNFSFLFSNKKDYDFNDKNWLMTNDSSNKEILVRLMTISKKIFIRNYSFLGFPTVFVFIPELICHRNIDAKFLDNEIKIALLERDLLLGQKIDYSAKELMKICEHGLSSIYENEISKVPLVYIAFLCSIVIGNKDKTNKLYKRMQKRIKFNKKYYDATPFENNIILAYYDLLYKNEKEVIIVKNLYKSFASKLKIKYNISENSFSINILKELFIKKITKKFINNLLMKNPNIINSFTDKELEKQYIRTLKQVYEKNKTVNNIL